MLEVNNGSTAVYTYDALNHRVRSQTPAGNDEYTYQGTVATSERSGPFGEDFQQNVLISGADEDPDQYTGIDHDTETSTEHAQFRQLASTHARWMSPDPYDGSYDPGNPQSLNRYSYALNNPLALVDAAGLAPCDDGGDDSDARGGRVRASGDPDCRGGGADAGSGDCAYDACVTADPPDDGCAYDACVTADPPCPLEGCFAPEPSPDPGPLPIPCGDATHTGIRAFCAPGKSTGQPAPSKGKPCATGFNVGVTAGVDGAAGLVAGPVGTGGAGGAVSFGGGHPNLIGFSKWRLSVLE